MADYLDLDPVKLLTGLRWAAPTMTGPAEGVEHPSGELDDRMPFDIAELIDTLPDRQAAIWLLSARPGLVQHAVARRLSLVAMPETSVDVAWLAALLQRAVDVGLENAEEELALLDSASRLLSS